MPRKVGVLAWLNVVLVGALVLGIVFGLRLTNRLDAGQKAVNGLKPEFVPARVQGDQTGINFVSSVVNTLDPITTAKGSAASEVTPLINLVATKTGLSQAAVLQALSTNFPHTTALLQAIPLSSVTAQLPTFLNLVASLLHVSLPQLVTTLQTSFPDLYQAVANLPAVTGGWDSVPGLNGLTRFNGAPVVTAPQLRDYFAADVVPVVAKNGTNFHRVATYFPPVKDIAPLLIGIGAIAILYGLIMMLRSATKVVKPKEGRVEWTVVLLLGILVLALVFGAQVFPRLDGGSHLLRDAAPAYTPTRVAGDQAGIAFFSDVVNLSNPIMNPQGGAAAEIGTLLTTLEGKTHLTEAKLLDAVDKAGAPNVANLLAAVPLSSVSAEIPGLLTFLEGKLGVTQAQLLQTLQTDTPGIAQAITNLPVVVNGWDNYPGGRALTRFNGTAVTNAPQLRDYFASDVIAGVVATAPNFRTLNGRSPVLSLFPGVLTVIGILVVIYGLIMLELTSMPDPDDELAKRKARGPGGRRAAGAAAFT